MALFRDYVARCDECFSQESPVDGFTPGTTRAEAEAQFRLEGWLITQRRAVCPYCLAGE